MHGRLKVKTTAEQQEAKRKEREKKLKIYTAATNRAFEKRKNKDYDEEALQITAELLAANSDFTSMWNFRREIFTEWKEKKPVAEVDDLLNKELDFLKACLSINPKSYGVWHHRCFTMDHMSKPDWERELMLCNKFLEIDERNFHCWDYRRFVVKRSAVEPKAEFEYTTSKINTNFSNFSSWHYRSKLLPILHPDPKNWVGIQEDILLQEFDLVQNAFFTDPNDQSAWFYHRWLLGRGHTHLVIQALWASIQHHRIIVTLSKPVKVGKDCQLELKVDKNSYNCAWRTPCVTDCSHIWICDLEPDLQGREFHITLESEGEQQTETCCVSLGIEEAYWRLHHKPETLFSSDLSASTADILKQELDNCQQLHELEPDNKWTLLTIVSLMRALDPIKYESETMACFEKLEQVDPMRTNYYKDIRSKYVIENYISKELEGYDRINLSGQNLTVLHHLHYLTLVTDMELSDNQLTQVNGLDILQCLKKLNLAKNQISTCDGLGSMYLLEELDLTNNNLTNMESVQPLSSCPHLKKLHIYGNPLCELANAKEVISEMLPSVVLDI